MSFNNFRLHLLVRVVLLTATIWLLLLTGFKPQYTGTFIFLGVLVPVQIVLLIRYLEKSNQQLNKFLSSIHYDDFTESFSPHGEGAGFDTLYRKFNEVMQKFREIRAEKEADAHYYRTVVHHVGTGIISYKKSGEIHLCNAAAKKLLQVAHPHHITDLKLPQAADHVELLNLKHGEKALIKVEIQGQWVPLSVNAIDILLRGEAYRLLSVQNIQQELEEKEMEAWQNLIKVLTHEIMNSVTPISSLAASVSEELSEQVEKLDNEAAVSKLDLADIEKAVYTIQRRSEGLVHFVQDFRNLTQVPPPAIKPVNLEALLGRLARLMQQELKANQVQLLWWPPPAGIVLAADEHLLEQVFINLIKNAIQAMEDQVNEKQIQITTCQDENSRLIIEVADNGPGITREAAEKIFIPFFTTKRKGSGIGLSISKQIMRLHNGTISVHSPVQGGCVFRLQF